MRYFVLVVLILIIIAVLSGCKMPDAGAATATTPNIKKIGKVGYASLYQYEDHNMKCVIAHRDGGAVAISCIRG